MKTLLSPRQKEKIREWLDSKNPAHKQAHCPFYVPLETDCSFCEEWFPRIKSDEGCPCFIYDVDYVISIAKKMLGEK